MSFDQNIFNQFIIDNSVVGFFEEPLTLVSGRKSSWYVNWRDMSGTVKKIDKLSDFVLNFLKEKNIQFDCLFGTPDGATKLAVISQYKWGIQQESDVSLPMGRKSPKEHGAPKDRFFVGEPQGKIVVIEDVTTTGGSLLKTVKNLLENNYQVISALALTNRNENMDDGKHVSAVLSELGVDYLAMSQAKELLPVLIAKQKPSESILKNLQEEYDLHGQIKINFIR